ncbi:MAG: FIST C-terminal domain-containing protein [Spirochaetia bacterium]|nr:FIST C-terminal domain-containing protein [Spirochaetia bacterium]
MNAETTVFEKITKEAVEETVKKAKSKFAKGGVVILLPEGEKHRIKLFQKIFSEQNLGFVGFIFPQIIIKNKFFSTGFVLINFSEMPFYHIEENLSTDEIEYTFQMKETHNQLKEKIIAKKDYNLFIVFDALFSKIGSMTSELFILMGDRTTYSGVCCGSETFRPIDCIFTNERAYKNAAVFFLLEKKKESALVHDYQVPDKIITATSAAGNKIISIDWRPAFDVYSQLAESQYKVKINSKNFYEHAVHFPFGIVKGDNTTIVRIPVALLEDRAIACVGEIRENTFLTLLKAPDIQKLGAAKQISKTIGPNDNILLFYCAGRRMHFKEKAVLELEKITSLSKNNNITGALSLGEIGSFEKNSFPEFHNGALLSLNL